MDVSRSVVFSPGPGTVKTVSHRVWSTAGPLALCLGTQARSPRRILATELVLLCFIHTRVRNSVSNDPKHALQACVQVTLDQLRPISYGD